MIKKKTKGASGIELMHLKKQITNWLIIGRESWSKKGGKGHDQGGNEYERTNKKFEEQRSRYEVQGKNAVYDRSHLG